ncbi:aldo/keto reductase [Dongshaea marina]|uniref:aldo/keto reductase n=1 Tax=Dongshaea marina TaxID=2047966 RepID=UPI000D3E30FC|nr:aldo/keto reductase [Dongshaea marina]
MADWGMSPQQRLAFIKQHLELGVTTVDHADIYGDYRCETLFGEALRLEPVQRSKMQIVSKCGIKLVSASTPERQINHYDTSKAHIVLSVENSLKRLHTDYLDLLLIHRPDALMDADEVVEAFNTLKESGKVRHFGVSNFTPSQFELLQSRLDQPLVTNQVEINPLNFTVVDDGTLDQLQRLRARPMAWSCLAGGDIFSARTEQGRRVHRELESIADELGCTSLDQVVYAWIMTLPSQPLPIIGSGQIQRVKSAIDSLRYRLTPEQWYRVWVASRGHSVP